MRYRMLFPLLSVISFGVNSATPARQVTFGEIYRAHESKSELTSEQRTYLLAVATTASWIDAASWSRSDRGLYCLPDSQRLTPEFLLRVMNNELSSDRGWVYMDSEPVARIIVNGLITQYPCTDADVARREKLNQDILDSLGKAPSP